MDNNNNNDNLSHKNNFFAIKNNDNDCSSSSINKNSHLTLSRRRPISYRNQSISLQSKSMDWFLYDIDLCRERVNNSLNNSPNDKSKLNSNVNNFNNNQFQQ